MTTTIRLAEGLTELAGSTPTIQLRRLPPEHGATVYAKLETANPTGSAYDRTVAACLEEALESGRLDGQRGVVDAGFADYGVSLAAACASLGLRCVAVVPETSSEEAKRTIRALGADLILSPGPERIPGAIKKAREAADGSQGGLVYLNHHESPASVAAHHRTGEEIVQTLGKDVDVVVAGVGSGATLRGVAEILRERNPKVRVIAVEPSASAVLGGGGPGPHKIDGLGGGFAPPHHRTDLVDQIIAVSNEDAFATCRRLAREEGILVGPAGGAVAWAAAQVAGNLDPEMEVVAVLSSPAARYLSAGTFE